MEFSEVRAAYAAWNAPVETKASWQERRDSKPDAPSGASETPPSYLALNVRDSQHASTAPPPPPVAERPVVQVHPAPVNGTSRAFDRTDFVRRFTLLTVLGTAALNRPCVLAGSELSAQTEEAVPWWLGIPLGALLGTVAGAAIAHGCLKAGDALNSWQERRRLQHDAPTPHEQLQRLVELANAHALTATGISRCTENIREIQRLNPEAISGRAAADAMVALAQGALPGPGCFSDFGITASGLSDLAQAIGRLRSDGLIDATECAQALQGLARTVGDRNDTRTPEQRRELATLIDHAAGALARQDPPLLPHAARIQLLAATAQSLNLSDADLRPLMQSALVQDSGNTPQETIESLAQRLQAMTPAAPTVCVDHALRQVLGLAPREAFPFTCRVAAATAASLPTQTLRLFLDSFATTGDTRRLGVVGLAQAIGRHFRPELAHEALAAFEAWHAQAPTSPAHAALLRSLLHDAVPLSTRLLVHARLAAVVGMAQATQDCRTRAPFKDALRDTPAGERVAFLRAALELNPTPAHQVEAVLACLDMDDWPAGLAAGGLLPPARVAQLITSLGQAPADLREPGRAEQIARLTQASQQATDEALLRCAVDTLRALPELQPVEGDPEETARRTHRLQSCLLDACSSPSLYISAADARRAAQAEHDLEPPTEQDFKSSDTRAGAPQDRPAIAALHHPWLTDALWQELTRCS